MRALAVAGYTAGAMLGGVSAAAAYGTVSKSSQLFGPSVYRGPGRRRTISLTFDDGPSEGTLALLDYLAEEKVWATFFMCGSNVKRLPHVAGRVAAAGHEIGNSGSQTTIAAALEQFLKYAQDPANGVWLTTVEKAAKYIRSHRTDK